MECGNPLELPFLAGTGLLESPGFSTAILHYPVQAKETIVVQVVDHFSNSYVAACGSLVNLPALKWTLECIGTAFSLSSKCSEVIEKAITLYLVWVREPWRRPPCVEANFEFVTREIILHTLFLFGNTAAVAADAQKAFLCSKGLELLSSLAKPALFQLGSVVEVHSLVKMSEINGCLGFVSGYSEDRVLVKLYHAESAEGSVAQASKPIALMVDKLISREHITSKAETHPGTTPQVPASNWRVLVNSLLALSDHLLLCEETCEARSGHTTNTSFDHSLYTRLSEDVTTLHEKGYPIGGEDTGGDEHPHPSKKGHGVNRKATEQLAYYALGVLFQVLLSANACNDGVGALWEPVFTFAIKWQRSIVFVRQWACLVKALTVSLQGSFLKARPSPAEHFLETDAGHRISIFWHSSTAPQANTPKHSSTVVGLSEHDLFSLWRRSLGLLLQDNRACGITSFRVYHAAARGLRTVSLLLSRCGWWHPLTGEGIAVPTPSPSCSSVFSLLHDWLMGSAFSTHPSPEDRMLRAIYAVQSLSDIFLRPHPLSGECVHESPLAGDCDVVPHEAGSGDPDSATEEAFNADLKKFFACLTRIISLTKGTRRLPAEAGKAGTALPTEAVLHLTFMSSFRNLFAYKLNGVGAFCRLFFDYIADLTEYGVSSSPRTPLSTEQTSFTHRFVRNSSFLGDSDDEGDEGCVQTEHYHLPLRRDALGMLGGLLGRMPPTMQGVVPVAQFLLSVLTYEKDPVVLAEGIHVCALCTALLKDTTDSEAALLRCTLTAQIAMLVESRHPACVYHAALAYFRCDVLGDSCSLQGHLNAHRLRCVKATLVLLRSVLQIQTLTSISTVSEEQFERLGAECKGCVCLEGMCAEGRRYSAFGHLRRHEADGLVLAVFDFIRECACAVHDAGLFAPVHNALFAILDEAGQGVSPAQQRAAQTLARFVLMSRSDAAECSLVTEAMFPQCRTQFFSLDGDKLLTLIQHDAATETHDKDNKAPGGITLILRDAIGRHVWQTRLVQGNDTPSAPPPPQEATEQEPKEVVPNEGSFDTMLARLTNAVVPLPSEMQHLSDVNTTCPEYHIQTVSPTETEDPKKVAACLPRLLLASLQHLPTLGTLQVPAGNVPVNAPAPAPSISSPAEIIGLVPQAPPPQLFTKVAGEVVSEREPVLQTEGCACVKRSGGVVTAGVPSRLQGLEDTATLRSALQMVDVTAPRETFRTEVVYLHREGGSAALNAMGLEWYAQGSTTEAALPTLGEFVSFVGHMGTLMDANEHPGRYHGGAAGERFRRRKLHYYSDSLCEAVFPVVAATPSALRTRSNTAGSGAGGSERWEDETPVRILWNDTTAEYHPTASAVCHATQQLQDCLPGFKPLASRTLDFVVTPLEAGLYSVRIILPLANERCAFYLG